MQNKQIENLKELLETNDMHIIRSQMLEGIKI
jgi:hypothetical protein